MHATIKAGPETPVRGGFPGLPNLHDVPRYLTRHLRPSDYTVIIGDAILHGRLEDIHDVLARAMASVVRFWIDPTHQPGEPLAPKRIPSPDAAEVQRWLRWLDTAHARELAPDVSVTEFHRADPNFWATVRDLARAARLAAGKGRDVPRLLPPHAQELTVAPLATGEAMVVITTGDGTRIATKPLARWRLTPSEGGTRAAAEVLAVITEEVTLAHGPRSRT
ncbi:hypothetical protein [Plantactinospora sp. CA-290183]|uniref:hypothetical protein n=1 Tax=Plantactinospora sp. CA-290183 TaxID=3240006 RepID=UPI003D8DE798